jgi:glucose/arabinose dehydrogenase
LTELAGIIVVMRILIPLLTLTIAPAALLCAGEAPKMPLPRIQLEPFLTGLDKPVYITHHNTNRLYVVEQTGKVKIVEDGKPLKKPFLDLSEKVNVDYECGVLSIAFHPDYANNRFVYVYYTALIPTLKCFVAEFRANSDGESIDPSSERILLHFSKPYPNHNGGLVKFGPDGMLYIGTGDGGMANDPFDNAQSGLTWMGKILRIDVNKRDPYAIPKDNPFINDNTFLPEIYAYGLRNPWRFSFDRETKLLYAGDVGQDKWEEIHIVQKGDNCGWRIKEGKELLHPVPKVPKLAEPIYVYPRNVTAASVTGGYVYRGKASPSLVGWYIFADYVDGRLFALKYENGKVIAGGVIYTPQYEGPQRGLVRPKNLQPSSFGEDKDGELYLTDVTNGKVFRVVQEGMASAR